MSVIADRVWKGAVVGLWVLSLVECNHCSLIVLVSRNSLRCKDVVTQDAGHVALVMFGNHCDVPRWHSDARWKTRP